MNTQRILQRINEEKWFILTFSKILLLYYCFIITPGKESYFYTANLEAIYQLPFLIRAPATSVVIMFLFFLYAITDSKKYHFDE